MASSTVMRSSNGAPARCLGSRASANQGVSRVAHAPALVRSIGAARRARTVAVRATEEEVISEQDQTKLDELVNRWRMFDINGDGSIDREELRQLLESTESGTAVLFTQHWLPEDELDRIMEKYDRNNNGRIDFEEFQQIVYDGLMLEGALAEYEAAFKAVDSSGNGTIGATELAEVLRSTGNSISYENMVDIMQQYDKDESGQIEFEEFLLMFRDKLLDLQAVRSYMGARPGEGKAPSEALLDTPEGDIALIFSEQELDEVIAQSKAQGKVLVLFCALTWCRPCKAVQRPSQKLAAAYKDCTTWVKIFGNANEQTKSIFKKRLKIRSTPAFIMVKDGEVVLAQTGSNKEKLEAALRAALGAHPALPIGMLYPSAEALMAAAVDVVATATAPVPEPAVAPSV